MTDETMPDKIYAYRKGQVDGIWFEEDEGREEPTIYVRSDLTLTPEELRGVREALELANKSCDPFALDAGQNEQIKTALEILKRVGGL